jgi:hypothetical protein
VFLFLGLPDPHPDPLVRGADPRILIRTRIRTKMIPNTAYSTGSSFQLNRVDPYQRDFGGGKSFNSLFKNGRCSKLRLTGSRSADLLKGSVIRFINF